MYTDTSVHTDDSIIHIPKKIIKKTYIKAIAEKEAEVIKRKALEQEYKKMIQIKNIESEKLYILKKELEEYKSSSSNKIV